MARVIAKALTWTDSTSADVVAYDIYGEPTSAADFAARADAGTAPKIGEAAHSPFALVGLPDGIWQFAVVARDLAGNTASPGVVTGVPLDVTAPEAVTDVSVVSAS